MSRDRLFHEELELLAPVLSPTEADRCQAIGEEFIDGRCCHERCCHETNLDPSGVATSSRKLDLLQQLEQSLLERGKTLGSLPRDKFASRQLGLDLLTYRGLHEALPPPEAELLKVVLARFQARTNYWREVSWLLLSQGKKPCANP